MGADEEATGVADIYVQPGEVHLVQVPTILRTVLGSCVGVTFWNERLGIGALCHPMLPRCPEEESGRMSVAALRRYVDWAIREVAKQLDALGAKRHETEVKVFGGADVLEVEHSEARPTVGRMNADRALQILKEEGYSVIAQRLGGRQGVHIDFLTTNGEVRLRKL
ncbi:MAG TPA: chemotaxis protein CheD [Acidobacteriaceae bacterium]|jgi:chemotaxis protein CheD